MIRPLPLVALLAVLALAPPAFAHGGGHGPPPQRIADCKAPTCTMEEIVAGVEKNVLPMFVQSGKLDPSWSALKAQDAEQRSLPTLNTEWVVRFRNDTIQDPAKRLLHVFVTPTGHLVAVNHSGK